MANCIAKCCGEDRTRTKTASRLGSVSATAEANTWNTFASVYVFADGHGGVEVRQNGKVIHRFEWGPEYEPPAPPPPPTETPDDPSVEKEA